MSKPRLIVECCLDCILHTMEYVNSTKVAHACLCSSRWLYQNINRSYWCFKELLFRCTSQPTTIIHHVTRLTVRHTLYRKPFLVHLFPNIVELTGKDRFYKIHLSTLAKNTKLERVTLSWWCCDAGFMFPASLKRLSSSHMTRTNDNQVEPALLKMLTSDNILEHLDWQSDYRKVARSPLLGYDILNNNIKTIHFLSEDQPTMKRYYDMVLPFLSETLEVFFMNLNYFIISSFRIWSDHLRFESVTSLDVTDSWEVFHEYKRRRWLRFFPNVRRIVFDNVVPASDIYEALGIGQTCPHLDEVVIKDIIPLFNSPTNPFETLRTFRCCYLRFDPSQEIPRPAHHHKTWPPYSDQ